MWHFIKLSSICNKLKINKNRKRKQFNVCICTNITCTLISALKSRYELSLMKEFVNTKLLLVSPKGSSQFESSKQDLNTLFHFIVSKLVFNFFLLICFKNVSQWHLDWYKCLIRQLQNTNFKKMQNQNKKTCVSKLSISKGFL